MDAQNTQDRIRKALDSLVYLPSLRDKASQADAVDARGILFSSEPAPDSKASAARPWDRQDLYRRVRTFRATTWFCKPETVGPVVCARHGWVNVGLDLLQCEFCHAKVGFPSLPNMQPEQLQKAADSFVCKLREAHDGGCPWRANCCSAHVAQFPAQTPELVLREFESRLAQLQALEQLPRVQEEALGQLTAAEREQLQRFADTGPTVRAHAPPTLPRRLDSEPLGLLPQPSASAPSTSSSPAAAVAGGQRPGPPGVQHPSASARERSARLLALFGWHAASFTGDPPAAAAAARGRTLLPPGEGVLFCATCGARQGLWNVIQGAQPPAAAQRAAPARLLHPSSSTTAAAAAGRTAPAAQQPSGLPATPAAVGHNAIAAAASPQAPRSAPGKVQGLGGATPLADLFGSTIAGGSLSASKAQGGGDGGGGGSAFAATAAAAAAPFGASSPSAAPAFGAPRHQEAAAYGSGASSASTAGGQHGAEQRGESMSLTLSGTIAGGTPPGVASPGAVAAATGSGGAQRQQQQQQQRRQQWDVVDASTMGLWVAGWASPGAGTSPAAGASATPTFAAAAAPGSAPLGGPPSTAPPPGPFGAAAPGSGGGGGRFRGSDLFGVRALKAGASSSRSPASAAAPPAAPAAAAKRAQQGDGQQGREQETTPAAKRIKTDAGTLALAPAAAPPEAPAAAAATSVVPQPSATPSTAAATAVPAPHPSSSAPSSAAPAARTPFLPMPSGWVDPLTLHRAFCPWARSVPGGDGQRCGWRWCLAALAGTVAGAGHVADGAEHGGAPAEHGRPGAGAAAANGSGGGGAGGGGAGGISDWNPGRVLKSLLPKLDPRPPSP